MKTLRKAALATLMLLSTQGCSGDDVSVITGRPTMPEAQPMTTMDTSFEIGAVGSTADRVIAGAPDGVYSLQENTLSPLAVFGQPSEAGPVVATSRRASGSSMVAAQQGLFYTDGSFLVPSAAAAGVPMQSALCVDSVGADSAERVWIGGAQGLYQLSGGTLRRWDIGTVTAVRDLGSVVLAAVGAVLLVLDPANGDYEEIDHDFGAIRSIARGAKGLAYLATDRGLFTRAADGSFTQYTLSDSDTPTAARAVGYDPRAGAYVATSFGLVRLNLAAQLEGAAPYDVTSVSDLTVDSGGDVWLSSGTQLLGLFMAEPVSFAAEVKPIFEAKCIGCHGPAGPGTPIAWVDYDAASENATLMAARVTGQGAPMPPLEQPQLSAQELETLLRWYRTGMAP